MDGMVPWLDALDVDGDGSVDSNVDGTALPSGSTNLIRVKMPSKM